jgi:MoaA/NifB/PqqE/SkfB family radical SAM enzyme
VTVELPGSDRRADYGARRLTVELADACNLRCSYCLRDEDALHPSKATFLPVELLERVLGDAREQMCLEQVTFTGGEPTLHPQFEEILQVVENLGLTCSFVTNGWHFERIWPALARHRGVVTHVAFSLDGSTREAHDAWRGAGSFDRVVRAFTRCWAGGVPFTVKVVIRRDTIPQFEACALLVARMGATGLSFAHVMPTSQEAEQSALTLEERLAAEREIGQLARIFKMRVSLDVGYYNTALTAPCSPLAGVSGNINYKGELTLCCNLSGYRGASGSGDVIADLNTESFREGRHRLQLVARAQAERRVSALESFAADGRPPDLRTASPCQFCLSTLGKTPWIGSRTVLLRPE